jgi:hypothetical protein
VTKDWNECQIIKFIKLYDYGYDTDGTGPKKIDMMKAGVEGMELMVLEGARETLKRCKPKLQIKCHVFYNRTLLRKVSRFITEKISDKYQRPLNPSALDLYLQ